MKRGILYIIISCIYIFFVVSCQREDNPSTKHTKEMGYFLFGGSDIVMIFQKGVEVELLHDGDHLLMGEPYAQVTQLPDHFNE